jgi:murein DD-endopeptidase MepM/ murein hydrolase activator NlpD
MSKTRYIRIQIIPDDASEVWTIRLRYRFFEFLFYAVIIALFAVALAAVKITEINGKVLTANHLASVNKQLLEKQEKMGLLERELAKIAEQERKIRGIVQTFISEQGVDTASKDRDKSRFSAQDLERYVAQVRALERKARGLSAASKGRDLPESENIPDIWPVPGIVSQAFNMGHSAETRHEGVDIIAENNALVMSAAAGIVLQAGWDRDLGKFVRIDHDFRTQTLYAHLSRSFVQVGDRVQKGTSIGTVGTTGNSFGPHLHYEILVNGKNVDPQQYLK